MDESKKSAVESPPADMLLVLPIGVSADFIESKLSDLPDLPVERVHVDEECRHRYGSIVDGDRRTVTCKRCNGPVDPVTVEAASSR